MATDAFLERALRDPDTGLPNVPFLQLIRDWEERRARRRHYSVRLLKVSVTGGDDRVLRTLGWRLLRAVRDSDFLASKGPHQFQVLLTSPDAEQFDALQHRISKIIDDLNARHPDLPPLRGQMEIEGGLQDAGGGGGDDDARWMA